jgi:4-hydroxy-3-methylbut-2-enyl diphosphate reductase
MGYAGGDGMVVSQVDGVEKIPDGKKICVVAQTTQNEATDNRISRRVRQRFPNAEIFQTICDSTHKRQKETIRLAATVDAMVVVGGKNSANTSRLAELVRESGKPVFPVETDDEIDPSWFMDADVVGITAGASTPNWIIQRVVRKVEDIVPTGGSSTILFRMRQALNFLVESDLYGAIAAGCLSYVATQLQGLTFRVVYFLIAMSYVYSMHIWNRFADAEAGRLKDPSRAQFYERHGAVLRFVGIGSMLFALCLSVTMGVPLFIFLLAASIGGVTYSFSFIPSGRLRSMRFRRLKDIPGSKTLFIALAWAGITTLTAPLRSSFRLDLNLVSTFLLMAALVLIRSTTFDLRDIQGDLIIGNETIPIVLGKKNSERLLILLVSVAGVALLVLPVIGVLPYLAYGLLGGILYVGCCLRLVFRHEFMRSEHLELLIDGGLIILGLIGLIWSLLHLPV